MQGKPSGLEVRSLDLQMLNKLIAPCPLYAALIFDCDGTIADTLAVHFQTWTYECIVYEDSDVGLEAARRAGMRWIDVRILGKTA